MKLLNVCKTDAATSWQKQPIQWLARSANVKRCLYLLLCLLFLSTAVNAIEIQDKKLFDKAAELTYEGQIKKVEELTGQLQPHEKTKEDDDWSGTSMFLSMIWGSIGTGYFIYGKRQGKAVFLLCGIGLIAVPIFVSSLTFCTVACLIMTLLPFKIEL